MTPDYYLPCVIITSKRIERFSTVIAAAKSIDVSAGYLLRCIRLNQKIKGSAVIGEVYADFIAGEDTPNCVIEQRRKYNRKEK